MGKQGFNPGDGAVPATADVAALISAVSLPFIEPFGPGDPVLAGLPAYTPHPVPVPEPASQVSVARSVQDATVAALAAVRILEARTAALKAALVVRHLAAVRAESAALALYPHQSGVAESSAVEEIATTLLIPQGSATALAHQCASLADHPDTFDALGAGELSWRHACTILEETRTLSETPATGPADITAFEARLLAAAPGTTGGGFAARARKLREGLHPETLTTRMREAIAKRSVSVDPGKNGMAWLTLHLPAPAAHGALAQCTRLARAQQGPDEHRTLDQIRADTAAIILLGQALPAACTTTGATGNATPAGSAVGSGAASGVPVGELIEGLAAAVRSGGVDGIGEDPMGEYYAQLEAVRNGKLITDPPLPAAQVIITVPALGLLGITNEPAQLAGHGPIPEEIARKLLLDAGTFLRVLTDPLTNIPLTDLPPDRYRLREAEKTLLRALNETCGFPNCTNPALDTEIDHITPYAQGGPTTVENSLPECKRHHGYKHFRDDKDKHGRYRQDLDPDRAGIKLRGWKPSTTADGRVAWTSPTGKYHPPQPRDTEAPAYPKWLKKRITKTLRRRNDTTRPDTHTTITASTTPGASPGTGPRIDLTHSPFENLLEYSLQHHPKKDGN